MKSFPLKTAEFKSKSKNGTKLEDFFLKHLLMLREAARRT